MRRFDVLVWEVFYRNNERPKTASEIARALRVGPERVRPLLREWLRSGALYHTLPSEKERKRGARNAYGVQHEHGIPTD